MNRLLFFLVVLSTPYFSSHRAVADTFVYVSESKDRKSRYLPLTHPTEI